jgi:hypothetical protein
MALRVQLAERVQAQVYAAAPDVYRSQGPLLALEYLADLERGSGVPVGPAGPAGQ